MLRRMGWTGKSNQAANKEWFGRHRFEHWYRDNQVYFITARCRDKFPALAGEEAKAIFWERFEIATRKHGFRPWVTSVLDNHYHTIGYLERAAGLAKMMHLLHGGVAKLVNDLLEPRVKAGELKLPCLGTRLIPFWRETKSKNYMDGLLRDETQGRRTYRYVLLQSQRHGLVRDWREYPHTRVLVSMPDALAFANERGAWLEGVRYKRYEGP
jgi:REP element-mobilizing transposase RayT